jgi:hypothetical protein
MFYVTAMRQEPDVPGGGTAEHRSATRVRGMGAGGQGSTTSFPR